MCDADHQPVESQHDCQLHVKHVTFTSKLSRVCALQIISLGSHSIDGDFEQAVLLMEVMPSLLAKRHFEPLNTLAQLEPGFRDSPEPDEDMTIVFVKVGIKK